MRLFQQSPTIVNHSVDKATNRVISVAWYEIAKIKVNVSTNAKMIQGLEKELSI